MKKIARFSVDYPITILMMVLGVLLLGYISFQKLGMDIFPDLNNPRIFVELTAGENPPEEIEEQFVKAIEAQSIQQQNAIQVSSVSQTGAAQIIVEYAWDTNMDEAFLDLQKTLTSFTQNSEIDELTISQHDPNAAPIILLGLSHPDITDMDELRKIAENYLQNELIRLEGIADVTLLGQEEKEVVIETNDYLMEAYNITPSTIANRLIDFNRNISGGSITETGRRYTIKGIGELETFEDIENTIVAYKNVEPVSGTAAAQSGAAEMAPVFLKDLAKISFTSKKPENIVKINGKRCIGLAIYKETKYNTVRIVDNFFENIIDLRKALPGYELTVLQNKGAFITDSVNEVKKTALIGILFAVFVLFIFLRRIGTTAIISLAIPISIIATFNLMYFKGLTLNIMTLGGLALGAGMLVDNAIVVMENIFRNLESGLSLKEAAVLGTSQVSGAITASTITTIIVFLPIVYLHGTAGELFREQAWTVAFSLVSSLIVAILVIPMLCTKLLKNTPATFFKRQSVQFPRYEKFLSAVLKARWIVITVAVVMVVIALRLIPIVGSEFIPKTELNEYSVDITLPEGTELFRTEKVVDSIEHNIRGILGENIETIYSITGTSNNVLQEDNSVFSDENTASIKFILKSDHNILANTIFVEINAMLSQIPDLDAQVNQEQTALELTLGQESSPIVVEIHGEDMDKIQELTDFAAEEMSGIDDLFNIETSLDEGRPEVGIVLDRVRAGYYNIGVNELISQLGIYLEGTDAGQWESEGEIRDINIEFPKIGLYQLEDILITSGEQKIPLSDIADIRISNAPKEIFRKNQARVGMVTANLRKDRPLDQVVGDITEKMDVISKTFPANYKYEITGEEQKRKDAFQNLKFALILSLVLVYMVLASKFESIIQPFTIILSIPLAVVGAILIFFFVGKSLNIMAYIGIIMLVGIAVNDAIILVDMIIQLKNEGMPKFEAIIQAGQRRIRPIIMTSLTTILALLPLTFGFGKGAALRSPMALAVIGGLITSTLLTLVVIPCVYSVMDSFGQKVISKFRA
ncbi:efflux RND transporter permease subunit [Candidatus Latescibacterota bacterium]